MPSGTPDHGTPVGVLRELMGHRSMVTTQGYFRVRDQSARRAVQTLAPLQIDRHGDRTMTGRRAAGRQRAAASAGRPDRGAARAVH